ncbi:hypothetical protein [Streptomyces sp. NPDC005438]|uniref:hypothetical protein n=1 Tax=Streptomyces sp. NPDC005438 TaxID=3156880 RepID=UPI0033A0C4B7
MSARDTGRLRTLPLTTPVPFDGRHLDLPAAHYDWLHLTLRADTTAVGTVWLHYADGTDPEQFEVPAGDTVSVRVPVTRQGSELRSVRLPERPGLALSSLTTVATAREG